MDVRAARSPAVLIVAVALGLAGVAHAQEPANPVVPPAPLAPPSMQPPPAPPPIQSPLVAPSQTVASTSAMPEDKNPATALSLSVLGTAAGLGMMAVGAETDSGALGLLGIATTLVGPSLGHFYAGEPGRGVAQSGIRVGGAGLMLGGAIWLFAECFSLSGEPCEGGAGPAIVMATGLAVTTGSALYSIYDAPRAARRQNARARRLVLTPAPVVGPDHSSGFGLHLGGQF
jgi:hypothetical protein